MKPCVRCTVPSVDPATGVQGTEPGDTLAIYRDDARMDGVTFGMNGIVTREANCGAVTPSMSNWRCDYNLSSGTAPR